MNCLELWDLLFQTKLWFYSLALRGEGGFRALCGRYYDYCYTPSFSILQNDASSIVSSV